MCFYLVVISSGMIISFPSVNTSLSTQIQVLDNQCRSSELTGYICLGVYVKVRGDFIIGLPCSLLLFKIRLDFFIIFNKEAGKTCIILSEIH